MNKKLTILLLSLLSLNVSADMAGQATQLLNYFGTNCFSNGEWTRTAMNSAQNVISVLENIKNDDSCKSISGTISDLSSLNAYISNVNQDNNQKDLMALQKEEQLLLQELQVTTDPTTITSITKELRAVQVEIAKLTGYEEYASSQSTLRKTQQAMETFVINTQALFNSINANQECIQKYPQLLSGVTSVAFNVLADVLPSYYGLALKGGVNLTGQVIEFARASKVNRHIRSASLAIAQTAFQCTLETLENQWCSAQDTLNAINLKETSITTSQNDVMYIGVRIIDRELPTVLNWLQKVRAGSTPTNTSEAERQNRALRRELRVRTFDRSAQGAINGQRDNYNSSTDDRTKWQYIKQIANSISFQFGMNEEPSIMEEIYPKSYIPYYLIGLSTQDAPRANGGYLPFENFDPFGANCPRIYQTQQPNGTIICNYHPPTLEEISDNLKTWIAQATSIAQQDILRVLQVSPIEVMDDAIYDEGRNPTTPYKAIQTIVGFLKNNIPRAFATINHRRIYEDTIAILTEMIKQIEIVHNNENPGDPLLALKEISNKAKLEFGTVLIEGRVNRSVRYTLNDIVIRRANEQDDLAAQLLAADDILRAIKKISPNITYESIRQDTAQGQSASQRIMNVFANYFSKNITESLKLYDEQALRANEPANLKDCIKPQDSKSSDSCANRRAKASLCVKLFGLDVWPKKIPFELCKGTQLISAQKNGPQTIIINEENMLKDFKDRVCEFRNYHRKAYIFQNYNLRLGQKKNKRKVTKL